MNDMFSDPDNINIDDINTFDLKIRTTLSNEERKKILSEKMLLVGILCNGAVTPGVNHLIKSLVFHLSCNGIKKIIGIK